MFKSAEPPKQVQPVLYSGSEMLFSAHTFSPRIGCTRGTGPAALRKTLLLLFLLGNLPGIAASQDSRDTLSPSSLSSTVQLQKELSQDRAPEKPRPSETEIQYPAEPAVAPAPVFEPSFSVKKIRTAGNRVIPNETLAPLIAPYENTPITLSSLNQLTKSITQLYFNRGYITSFAFVPPQKSTDDTLMIQIVEGRIGQIEIKGQRYFRAGRIKSYVKTQPGQVLHLESLQQSLREINQNRDRQAAAELVQGREPQTTDIVFKVKDSRPLHAGFVMDNEGIKTVGKKRFGFNLLDNNLTGLDDRLLVGTLFGSHFGSLFTQYTLPIPQTQTEWVFGFSHGQSTPAGSIKGLSLNNLSQNYYTGLTQTFFRSNTALFQTYAGMELTESRTLLNAGTLDRERLRIFQLIPALDFQDPWGFNRISQEFDFSTGLFGATIYSAPTFPRQGVQPQFFVTRGQWTRAQNLPAETSFQSRMLYQIPDHKLPYQQSLVLGGARAVRGYPELDYLADWGILGSLEYFIPSFFLPREWRLPNAEWPLRQQIQWVLFHDQGYGQLRGSTADEVNDRYLMGAGAGLRIRLYKNIAARLEWAHAFGAHPLNDTTRNAFYYRFEMEK